MTERYKLAQGEIPPDLLKQPLVFDTNVWLFINGPFIDNRDPRHKVYSALYSEALKAEAKIFLPQIVLGEFVRQSLHQYMKSSDGERPRKIHSHPEYSQWMADITDEVFHIVSACQLLDDSFTALNLESCFGQAATEAIDFNDVMLAAMCESHGLVLVTDDGDYAATKIPIASSNKKLLAKR